MKTPESAKIALIEDEPQMAEGIKYNLELEGYMVRTAADGEEGLELVLDWEPDLVLLDLMLPKMSGLEVLRELRKKNVWTPILVLTALNREGDIVAGLETGADDYVCKPFSLAELLARVRAVIRRSRHAKAGEQDLVVLGGKTEVDFLRYEIRRQGKRFPLSRFEAEILRYLLSRRGEVVSREDLLRDVWGYKILPQTRTVDNHIARIRKKLEDKPEDPYWIQTVHAIGYRFTPEAGGLPGGEG